jgi:hypothetical protein
VSYPSCTHAKSSPAFGVDTQLNADSRTCDGRSTCVLLIGNNRRKKTRFVRVTHAVQMRHARSTTVCRVCEQLRITFSCFHLPPPQVPSGHFLLQLMLGQSGEAKLHPPVQTHMRPHTHSMARFPKKHDSQQVSKIGILDVAARQRARGSEGQRVRGSEGQRVRGSEDVGRTSGGRREDGSCIDTVQKDRIQNNT